jgi:hypothetical protein
MKYNKFSDFPTYEYNPFWHNGVDLSYFRRYSSPNVEKTIIDVETGDTSDYIEKEKRTVYYDSQPFIKIYKTLINDLKVLSSPSGLILWDMISNLKDNSDEIRFDIGEFMAANGYSGKSNIYKGLTELLKHKIIARKAGSDGYFFINVSKIYIGKREKNNILVELLGVKKR